MEGMDRGDVVSLIDRMVVDLLADAGIDKPPVDCIALAQKFLGIVICLDSRQPNRGRTQRAAGQKQIFLRPEPREERHQWTVAHAIGEHLKPELLRRLGVENSRGLSGESLANLFGRRLLVPTVWFAADSPSLDHDLLALKKLYSTASHEVIAWRWLDLSDPCIVTIVDNDAIHRRRSNAWPTRRELTDPERRCQQHVSSHSKPHRLRSGNQTIHCWPIHQHDWKREILRTVIDGE